MGNQTRLDRWETQAGRRESGFLLKLQMAESGSGVGCLNPWSQPVGCERSRLVVGVWCFGGEIMWISEESAIWLQGGGGGGSVHQLVLCVCTCALIVWLFQTILHISAADVSFLAKSSTPSFIWLFFHSLNLTNFPLQPTMKTLVCVCEVFFIRWRNNFFYLHSSCLSSIICLRTREQNSDTSAELYKEPLFVNSLQNDSIFGCEACIVRTHRLSMSST